MLMLAEKLYTCEQYSFCISEGYSEDPSVDINSYVGEYTSAGLIPAFYFHLYMKLDKMILENESKDIWKDMYFVPQCRTR